MNRSIGLDPLHIDNYFVGIEEEYKKVNSLYGYGFTRDFFDDKVYKEYCKGYYDIAKDHYNILGDELQRLGQAITGLKEYLAKAKKADASNWFDNWLPGGLHTLRSW